MPWKVFNDLGAMIDGAGWLYKKAMGVVRDPEGRKASKEKAEREEAERKAREERRTNAPGPN